MSKQTYTRTCQVCLETFTASRDDRVLCDKKECKVKYQAAYSKRRNQGLPPVLKVRTCRWCGEVFSTSGRNRYDTDECRELYKRAKGREEYAATTEEKKAATRERTKQRKERAAVDPEFAKKVEEDREQQRRLNREREWAMRRDDPQQFAQLQAQRRERTKRYVRRQAERMRHDLVYAAEIREKRARIYIRRKAEQLRAFEANPELAEIDKATRAKTMKQALQKRKIKFAVDTELAEKTVRQTKEMAKARQERNRKAKDKQGECDE